MYCYFTLTQLQKNSPAEDPFKYQTSIDNKNWINRLDFVNYIKGYFHLFSSFYCERLFTRTQLERGLQLVIPVYGIFTFEPSKKILKVQKPFGEPLKVR